VSRSSRSRADADFVGGVRAVRSRGRRRIVLGPHQGLGGAHRQALGDDGAGGGLDRRRLVEAEQRAGVAHRQPPVLDHRAHAVGQLEQAHRVGHRRAVLADPRRDLVLVQAELVDQPLERQRLLDRVEIGALQVLDQRALEGLAAVDVLDHHRHVVAPGPLRGAPAALAGDQRVAAARPRPHHQRHDHAVGADRRRQLVELDLVEAAARLIGGRVDLLDRRLEVRARDRRGRHRHRGRRRRRRHQRAEAASEAAPGQATLGITHRAGSAVALAGWRARNSSATAR
jgi:hypothetical protein